MIKYTYEELNAHLTEKLNAEAMALDTTGVPVITRTVLREGIAADELLTFATEEHASLVVMGARGEGNIGEMLWGSTSSEFARKTTLPVLVIPAQTVFTGFERVALAGNIGTDEDIHELDLMVTLLKAYQAKLFVINVVKDEMEADLALLVRSARLDKILEPFGPAYEYPTGKSVEAGINTFVKEHEIQLAVMIPHRHNLLERIFLLSHSRKMIFHGTTPLLLLPSKKRGTPDAARPDFSLKHPSH